MLVPRAALTAAIVSSCFIFFIIEIEKQHESGCARIAEEPAASLHNALELCKRPLSRELLAYPCHLQTQIGVPVALNQARRMVELAVRLWHHCAKQQLAEDRARPRRFLVLLQIGEENKVDLWGDGDGVTVTVWRRHLLR
jgi:hypothetical protein